MVILKLEVVAFDLAELDHITFTGPLAGVYLKAPGLPFKLEGVTDADLAALAAMLDGASPAAIRLIPCPSNAADTVTVLKVAMPAAPGGGA